MTFPHALPRFLVSFRHGRGRLGLVLAIGMLSSASACRAEEDLGVRDDIFGSVHVKLFRTENTDSTPFVGTEKVVAKVTLGECLTGFYDSHPEWAPDGAKGSVVAEAWLDVLCDKLIYGDVFKCTPTGHTWSAGAGAGGRHQLRVDFNADNPDLERFDVRIGPLANESFAGCEPVVEVGFDGVEGFAAGNLVWRADPDFTQSAWGGTSESTFTDDPDPVNMWVERAD